jgi:hypothetical protein
MGDLHALIDGAVEEALSAHPDYLTAKGQASAQRLIVRKVTGALRDGLRSRPDAAEEERQPEQAPAQPEPQAEIVQIECWSKEWWALFVHKLAHGKSTSWMLQYARQAQPKATFAVKSAEMPADEVIDQFTNYPSNSEAVANWRPWFAAKGGRLPDWRERVWVFLPSPEPPDQQSAA